MDPNTIIEEPEMPNLKDVLFSDIDYLDSYFKEANAKEAETSWFNVREAAISFAELFDKMKDIKNKREE